MKINQLFKSRSISFKIIFGVCVLFVIILSTWSILFFEGQKKILNNQLNYRAETITKAAGIFCAYPLLIDDYIILQDYIEKIREVDSNIVMAEISRNDRKVVARYISDNYTDKDKKSIQFYVSSIKEKPPSNKVIGEFVIGISTKNAKRIILLTAHGLLIMSFVFLIILAVLINIFLNYLISKPLGRLDDFAQKISDGNLDSQLILDSADEFGRLCLTMDKMRVRLKHSYEEILRQNDKLEEKVKKRTKVLTLTNEKLEKSYQDLLDSQERIIYFVFHDDLTGLSNRRSCRDKLGNMINNVGKLNNKIAVLFIGLDDFKNVNDSFGSATGDEILKAVSSRLLKLINNGEVARWGSDEFVVLMTEIKNYNEAAAFAKKIKKAVNKPFHVEDRSIYITASIGISFFPDDGYDAESLVKNSNFALFQAKKEGKNKLHLFDKSLYDKILFNISIHDELKNLIFDKELMLLYQPKVNIEGKIVDLEALIRWKSKKFGYVSPDNFIPIAENSDIIIDIGNWVIKTACEQITAFENKGLMPVRIAVNLSPRHFHFPKLITKIKKILNETRCDARLLEIEITETSAMEKPENSAKIIEKISNLGIKISIDDFGVGYSSFSRLSELKFDSIKIDKSFVKHLGNDSSSKISINSIISLAHNLNKEVVAEGVETEEQFNILKEVNCDIFQGYLFGRPMPPDEIEKILKKK